MVTGNKYLSVFLEVLAAMFLLLSLYPIMKYGTLAGIQVPQHYSKGGSVDIWTTREFFIYLGLISIALYSFLSVCQSHQQNVRAGQGITWKVHSKVPQGMVHGDLCILVHIILQNRPRKRTMFE